jgi:tRNA (adenine57-N1/adenine58-N1)-methyltransferase
LTVGEKVLLIDPKGRRYLVTLKVGGEFHSHGGYIPHDELIGRSEGTTVKATKGLAYTALRPTLGDFVLKMPRGAQVIYPKDIADPDDRRRVSRSARPRSRVGSAHCRSGCPRWRTWSATSCEDFARAAENVVAFSGEGVLERYRAEIRDCYEGIDETRSTGSC